MLSGRGDWNCENGQRGTIKIVRTDIARLDNARPYRKGGHPETWQRGTRQQGWTSQDWTTRDHIARVDIAMSTLAIWCRVVRSRDVRSRDFSVPVLKTSWKAIFWAGGEGYIRKMLHPLARRSRSSGQQLGKHDYRRLIAWPVAPEDDWCL